MTDSWVMEALRRSEPYRQKGQVVISSANTRPSGGVGGLPSGGVTPRRGAHVAYEPTRDVVGLGNPIERCLATTGRGNRRWDGGQLAMTQDARDDRLLGHGGNNAE